MPNISNAQSYILDHENISLVFVGVLDYSNCPDDGWPKDLRKDQELFELILDKFKAERERYDHLMSSKKEIDLILSEGAEKAMKTANEVINRVRKKLGY